MKIKPLFLGAIITCWFILDVVRVTGSMSREGYLDTYKMASSEQLVSIVGIVLALICVTNFIITFRYLRLKGGIYSDFAQKFTLEAVIPFSFMVGPLFAACGVILILGFGYEVLGSLFGFAGILAVFVILAFELRRPRRQTG